MDIARDFELLAGLVIAIAAIAGAFIVRGWLPKIAVLVVGLVAAAYVAGFVNPPLLP